MLPCTHRGRLLVGGARCFCRIPAKPYVVPISQCDTCEIRTPHGIPTQPAKITPASTDCAHRSAEPLRIVDVESCKGCNGAPLRVPVHGCNLHQECTLHPAAISRYDDELEPVATCSTCCDRKTPPPPPQISVAVVIPCHNYGRFLAECLQSVFAQTHAAAEIIVVDDSSTDETHAVAAGFAGRGVRYLRTDAGHVHAARRAGYEATSAEALCFLDADDLLPPDYLAAAVEILSQDWRCRIVHSDMQDFGDGNRRREFPERVTAKDLERNNQIHAGSVVRRDALRIGRAFDASVAVQTHADWVLWRRVLATGGHSLRSPAVYQYRRHDTSMLLTTQTRPWFERASMHQDRITILTPLAGRADAWHELRAFFDRQAWPHEQTALVLADTSGDPEFHQLIREWALNSDYADVRVLRFAAGRPGLADEDRRQRAATRTAVNDAMCRIWSRLTAAIDSPWTWTIEDDVIPQDDAAEQLLHCFAPDVDAVCSPYRSRWHDNWLVHRGGESVITRGQGIERVTSAGFGCCLFRTPVLQDHSWSAPRGRWYDPWFFESNNLHLICNWNCPAFHLGAVPEG